MRVACTKIRAAEFHNEPLHPYSSAKILTSRTIEASPAHGIVNNIRKTSQPQITKITSAMSSADEPSPSTSASSSSSTTSAPSPPRPQIRHDWYQTDEKVVITVMIKNCTAETCTVQIQSDRVRLTTDSAIDYSLDLQLLHPIDADRSTYRISSVKVEITLVKFIGCRWANLTRPDDPAELEPPAKVVSIYKNDWNALEKSVENNEEYQEVSNTNFSSGTNRLIDSIGQLRLRFVFATGRRSQSVVPEDLQRRQR